MTDRDTAAEEAPVAPNVDIEDEEAPLADRDDTIIEIADEEVPLGVLEDEEVDEVIIEDEDTPLSSGGTETAQKRVWWWWILVIISAITGKSVYEFEKKKRNETVSDSNDSDYKEV